MRILCFSEFKFVIFDTPKKLQIEFLNLIAIQFIFDAPYYMDIS
jgi:hypothetical protein